MSPGQKGGSRSAVLERKGKSCNALLFVYFLEVIFISKNEVWGKKVPGVSTVGTLTHYFIIILLQVNIIFLSFYVFFLYINLTRDVILQCK